jgi:hypothetical protein
LYLKNHFYTTFIPLSHCKIEADFSGGHINPDSELLLLREVEKLSRLTQSLFAVPDQVWRDHHSQYPAYSIAHK